MLFSCGLMFPAEISTEREAAAGPQGDQSNYNNVTPTTSLCIASYPDYLTSSMYFLPVLFTFTLLSLVFYIFSKCS